MDIQELENFNLSDAVKFHKNLNPALWDADNKMRPEVRSSLLKIAEDFKQDLGIENLEIQDITVSGSNAAYSYTPHSDIDLHLIVDIPKIDGNDVYRELFDAKKYQYNAEHNYLIRGYDVELYVQDIKNPVESLGEYSLIRDDWNRIPKRRRANFNQTATHSKYLTLLALVKLALRSDSELLLHRLTKILKKYRRAGLDQHGEFGPENLAYKMLRNQGYIQKLYDHINAVKDRKLSVEQIQERKKKKKKKHWAWGGYWGLGYYGSDGGDSSGDGGGESSNSNCHKRKVAEASYPGNIGIMEVFKAFQMGTADQKALLKKLIDDKKDDLAWALIQKITGVDLVGQEFHRHSGELKINSKDR